MVAILASALLRVLFVGDSFTYFNDLPKLVQTIANAAPGGRLRCERITHGAWNLDQQWRGGAALARIRAFHPNVVVIQEEGLFPITHPARFQAAARRFVGAIRAAGARPMLLATWAPRAKPWTQASLLDANRRVGRALRVPVVPVGEAWRLWQAAPDAPDLYVAEGIHPNFAGSYLSALVLAGALRGRPLTTAPTAFDGGRGIEPAALPRFLDCARQALGSSSSITFTERGATGRGR